MTHLRGTSSPNKSPPPIRLKQSDLALCRAPVGASRNGVIVQISLEPLLPPFARMVEPTPPFEVVAIADYTARNGGEVSITTGGRYTVTDVPSSPPIMLLFFPPTPCAALPNFVLGVRFLLVTLYSSTSSALSISVCHLNPSFLL